MNRKAMTLVELMLAMGISVAVIFGTAQLLSQFKNTEAHFEERMETNLSISNFIDTFIKQLNHSSVMINNSIFTYDTERLEFPKESRNIVLEKAGDTFAVLFYDNVSQVSSDAQNVRDLTSVYQKRAICVDELKKIDPDKCSSGTIIDEWDKSRCDCIDEADREIDSLSVGINNIRTLKVMNADSYHVGDLILITTIDSNTNAGLYSVQKVDGDSHALDVEIVDSVPNGFNIDMNSRNNLGIPELIGIALKNTDQAILWGYRVTLMQYEVEVDPVTNRNRLMAKRWKSHSDTDFTSQRYISNNIEKITIKEHFEKEDRIEDENVRANEIGTFNGSITASIFEANTNNQNVRTFGSNIYFQNKGVERLNLAANTTIGKYEIIEPSVNTGIEQIRAVRCCLPTDPPNPNRQILDEIAKRRAFDYTGKDPSVVEVFPDDKNDCGTNKKYCGPDARHLEHYFKVSLLVAGKADISNSKYAPMVSFKLDRNDVNIYCWQKEYDTVAEINLLNPMHGSKVTRNYSDFYEDRDRSHYGEGINGVNMSVLTAICKIENDDGNGLKQNVKIKINGTLAFYNGNTGKEASIPFESAEFTIYSDMVNSDGRYTIKPFVPPTSKFCDKKASPYRLNPHTYTDNSKGVLSVFGYKFSNTGSNYSLDNIYPKDFFERQNIRVSSFGPCVN